MAEAPMLQAMSLRWSRSPCPGARLRSAFLRAVAAIVWAGSSEAVGERGGMNVYKFTSIHPLHLLRPSRTGDLLRLAPFEGGLQTDHDRGQGQDFRRLCVPLPTCLRSLASLQVIAVGPGIVLANGPALSTRGKVMRCSHDSTQLRSVLKVFAASCSTTDPTETQSRGSRQGSDAKSRGNQAVKAVPARGRAALACAGGTCQDSNQRYPKSDASCWYSDNE